MALIIISDRRETMMVRIQLTIRINEMFSISSAA